MTEPSPRAPLPPHCADLEPPGRRWRAGGSYRDLQGDRLDRGGEGGEGRVLDGGHDGAAICLEGRQDEGIGLDDLRLDQHLDGGGRE